MVIDANEKLDKEWIGLITEARNIGLSIAEVRKFILQNKHNSTKVIDKITNRKAD